MSCDLTMVLRCVPAARDSQVFFLDFGLDRQGLKFSIKNLNIP